MVYCIPSLKNEFNMKISNVLPYVFHDKELELAKRLL